ncbi:hypothetical protein I7I48_11296 [Histoplasma ohiense]|nr:hypothetical protein I7I48_11296 [Histoplasma ohiense (nom. inval.)]
MMRPICYSYLRPQFKIHEGRKGATTTLGCIITVWHKSTEASFRRRGRKKPLQKENSISSIENDLQITHKLLK